MAITTIEEDRETVVELDEIIGVDKTKSVGNLHKIAKSAIQKELEQYEHRLEDNIHKAVVALVRDDREMPDDPVVMSFTERILKDALENLLAAQHQHFNSIIKKLLLLI